MTSECEVSTPKRRGQLPEDASPDSEHKVMTVVMVGHHHWSRGCAWLGMGYISLPSPQAAQPRSIRERDEDAVISEN